MKRQLATVALRRRALVRVVLFRWFENFLPGSDGLNAGSQGVAAHEVDLRRQRLVLEEMPAARRLNVRMLMELSDCRDALLQSKHLRRAWDRRPNAQVEPRIQRAAIGGELTPRRSPITGHRRDVVEPVSGDDWSMGAVLSRVRIFEPLKISLMPVRGRERQVPHYLQLDTA